MTQSPSIALYSQLESRRILFEYLESYMLPSLYHGLPLELIQETFKDNTGIEISTRRFLKLFREFITIKGQGWEAVVVKRTRDGYVILNAKLEMTEYSIKVNIR